MSLSQMTTIPYSMFRKSYFYYVFIIVLTVTVISISSCEKDEVFEEAQNELNFPEIQGRFVHGKDLLQTPIIGDKINSLSSSVVSKSTNASGIQIDTSRIQVIESVDYKSYTFQIVQDSVERQSLLRNYMITIVNDTTTIQHLFNYEILPSGAYNMDNIQATLVTGDSLIPSFLKCIQTSFTTRTDCFEIGCSGEGHLPGDSECGIANGTYPGTPGYIYCTNRWAVVRENGPCGGADTGSGPGAGDGGSSVVIPVVPVDDEEVSDESCTALGLKLNKAEDQRIINELKNSTHLNYESGYKEENGQFINLTNPNANELYLPITPTTVGAYHNHNENYLKREGNTEVFQNTIKTFSPQDLLQFVKLLHNANTNGIPLKKVYLGISVPLQDDKVLNTTGQILKKKTYILKYSGSAVNIPSLLNAGNFASPENNSKYLKRIDKSRTEGLLKFMKQDIGLNLDDFQLFELESNGSINNLNLNQSNKLTINKCHEE